MNQKTINNLEAAISQNYPNAAGIVVQKNGTIQYEKYLNGCTSNDAIHIFSVTKSIFSALVGIAIEHGCIQSVNQRVLDFFPNYTVHQSRSNIQDVTIRHLLTMTAPFDYETEPYEDFFASAHWVNAALDLLGGDIPAGTFRYSPFVGAHILSGILTNATGQPVLDFATEHLFSPLGIQKVSTVVLPSQEEHFAFYRKERHNRGWVVDSQGVNTASWGLTLTPIDMAKIGQLYLNKGLWEGKQLLSKQWIAESTQIHARWNTMSYGYLWWIMDDTKGIFAALGDGGNAIYVNTSKNLVVSIASLLVPDANDPIDLIMGQIEPMFED